MRIILRLKLAVCCFVVLVLPFRIQGQETVNPGTVLPDDSVALENKVRNSKFNTVLPQVMRDNEIDMWIHVMRPWTPDPLNFEFGSDMGIFIFTDRGEDRIERAIFAGHVSDRNAYNIISRPRVQLPTFVMGSSPNSLAVMKPIIWSFASMVLGSSSPNVTRIVSALTTQKL